MTEPEEKPGDERWGSYPETVLIFTGETEVYVDLREQVPPPTRSALSAIGLDGEFGVLTAFNPRGQNLSADENTQRMDELESDLTTCGHAFIRVNACSPDRSHCECSVALKSDRQRAIDIAKRWDQVAIFWWDGSAFWIYGAISPGSLQLPL